MNLRFVPRLLAATLALSPGVSPVHAASPTTQPATRPTVQQLSQQLAAMQARIADLETRNDQIQRDRAAAQAATQAATQGADDVRRHESSLDANQFSFAVYEAGARRLTLQSPDGNYVMHPFLYLQVRDVTNDRAHTSAGDNTQNGIELRRVRFGFVGNLFGPDLLYFINWTTYRSDAKQNAIGNANDGANNGKTIGTLDEQMGGLPALAQAWAAYHLPQTDLSIKGGQMHDPLDHESMIGSRFRNPEASLQADVFANVDTYTQAFTAIYNNYANDKNPLHTEAGMNDGIRSANTSFQSYPATDIYYDWGAVGRAEYKFFGQWKDYYQFTALGNTEDLLVLGMGADNSEAGKRDEWSHTLDLQYATTNRWMLYASYFGRYTRHNTGIPNGSSTDSENAPLAPPASVKDTYEPSAQCEVAYLLNQHWELFGRYEYLHLAATPAGSHNNVNEFSLGYNYYIFGRNCKFSNFVMYLPNGIPIDATGEDVLANNNHPEAVLVFQVLLFI